MIGATRHLICEADVLIARGEQPEIVALAVMLLAEHAAHDRALRRDLAHVRRTRVEAEDLLNILVLFDDNDDVVVDRQRRWPGNPIGSYRRGDCKQSKYEGPDRYLHSHVLKHLRRSRARLEFRLRVRDHKPDQRGIS